MLGVDSRVLVELIADSLKMYHSDVEFGFIEFDKDISKICLDVFEIELNKVGFEIIIKNDEILTEGVKNIIFELYNSKVEVSKISFSNILSDGLHYDYNYIATCFKKINGFTIQSYIILIKVNKIKEILKFNNTSLKDIAFDLNYSSTAHLSNQFKKSTGITISKFKDNIRLERLKSKDFKIEPQREENTP